MFSDWWERKRSWSSIHSRSHGATRSTGNYKLLSHYHHSNTLLNRPHPCCFFFFFSKGTSGDIWTTSETMTYMFAMWYPSCKLQCTVHYTYLGEMFILFSLNSAGKTWFTRYFRSERWRRSKRTRGNGRVWWLSRKNSKWKWLAWRSALNNNIVTFK